MWKLVFASVLGSVLIAATAHAGDEIEFPVVLGTYSTTLIGSLPARTANIRLAAAAIDSTVLEPAQVLSFNRRVGERSVARGYQRAPVILHQARDVQVGGGVCQLASTLLDAALLAGLRTTERHRHSYPVDYIPLAQDATIVWGAKDLKILNCLDQRVRFRAEVVGTTLTVRVEGEAPAGAEYELTTDDYSSDPGDAASAREVELFRVRRVAGEETGRELLYTDVYPPRQVRR
jgi:vancomycin resistance protein YoaR